MVIPFRKIKLWKRSSGVFYATKVSHAIYADPSLRGFYNPSNPFCTPGWGIMTSIWSGRPSPTPFFRFSAVASLLVRGFRDFAPRLTCPPTVCHSIPVWLPRSKCRFFLRLPRPTPFAKGIRLLLHAPAYQFARWTICVITFIPLARAGHFSPSNLGAYSPKLWFLTQTFIFDCIPTRAGGVGL